METYAVMIDNLRRAFKSDKSLYFLRECEAVKSWLETNPTKKTKKPLSANSLKTYYCAIKHAIKDNPEFVDVLPFYEREVSKYVKAMKTKQLQEQFVCWNCVLNVRNTLLEEFDDEPCWEAYQEYLIVCLYTMMPPERLDYAPMRFVKEAPADSIENYCVLTDDKATFVLNSYKTAWKNGTLRIDIPFELAQVLRSWRKSNTTEWLLVKGKDKRPMTKQELGLAIKDIFTRTLGIDATLNVLRHSYRQANNVAEE
jgi:hypothetical protein